MKGDKGVNTVAIADTAPDSPCETAGLDLVFPYRPCAQAHGFRAFLDRPRNTGTLMVIDSKTRSGDYVNGSFASVSVMQHSQHDVLAYPVFSTSFPGLSISGSGGRGDGELKLPEAPKLSQNGFSGYCQAFEVNYCRCSRYRSGKPNDSSSVRKVKAFLTNRKHYASQ